MVCGGLWWFAVVCDGLWHLVCGGLRWFAVVCLLVIPLQTSLSRAGILFHFFSVRVFDTLTESQMARSDVNICK